ncbi:MAG: DUF4815 domain-containing protein [Desulfovibrionaceae bacterium]
MKIDNYYLRFDEKKNYEKLLARDGYPIQGAETNDLQEMFLTRMRRMADALFNDGDIIRDAQIVVKPTTGAVEAQAGAVYIAGAVRGVIASTFTIPTTGTVVVGIRLVESVISELEDKSLYNPAIGSRGEGEPGAWRLQITPTWGFDKDGKNGEFYPVYAVDDGIVRPKEAPPTLDSFTQGLARYDRDSTAGGSYVVNGLNVLQAADTAEAKQVYSVSAGRARVNGYGVELATDRRLVYAPVPDLRLIDTEVNVASADATQRITVAHAPIFNVQALRVTRRKKATLVHGAYLGAMDDIPDTSVVSIVEVKQGNTVYAQGTDYRKTGDKIDWSPSGAEPASGSTYDCTYDYITALSPENKDADGFDVQGAVAGSSILVTYNQALPRFDRLCLTQDGQFQWLQGVASELNPRSPMVPSMLLPLATVYQTWRPARQVVTDSIRVVPFSEISAINQRIDYVLNEVARQRLEADVFTRESGARVGMFVDPLLNDDMRDQGVSQTAAIVNGELILPITGAAASMAQDVVKPTALAYTPIILLNQPRRTSSMAVNPYRAFDPLPAHVTLTPAVDFWTETQSQWTSPATQVFSVGSGNASATSVSTGTQVVGTSSQKIEHLRPIEVRFECTGFGPGEALQSVTFDGINVTPSALSA